MNLSPKEKRGEVQEKTSLVSIGSHKLLEKHEAIQIDKHV